MHAEPGDPEFLRIAELNRLKRKLRAEVITSDIVLLLLIFAHPALAFLGAGAIVHLAFLFCLLAYAPFALRLRKKHEAAIRNKTHSS